MDDWSLGAVPTGEPTPNEDDGRVYHVSVGETLPAGAHTVSWRGIGDDGHVVTAILVVTPPPEG